MIGTGVRGTGMGLWVFAGMLMTGVVAWFRVGWGRLREEQRREHGLRVEFEAYARLDATLAPARGRVEEIRLLARRVCRVVAEQSRFRGVAMLTRDAAGKLCCAGSAGIDDLTVAALRAWGDRVVAEERGGAGFARRMGEQAGETEGERESAGSGWSTREAQVRFGRKHFGVELRRGEAFDEAPGQVWRRVVMVPLWTQAPRMAGALALLVEAGTGFDGVESEAMLPIETLAVKLARSLENAQLMERLMQAEKLAGLGQLAGGVAHELNNPLTAVLGYAELIAETTEEARVQRDAQTIAQEALRMREIVQTLLHFWRPTVGAEEVIDVRVLLGELAEACRQKLADRGVRLVVQAGAEGPVVRGQRGRLRQMFEHLLNNAAQAIAAMATEARADEIWGDGQEEAAEAAEEHEIRVTVTDDGRMLRVVVSDTGPGFREAGRVFDPFYTTQQPGSGTGLGLSVCYGIVREHRGEISAFNLHPRGAAVVVELPLGDWVAAEEAGVGEEERVRWG